MSTAKLVAVVEDEVAIRDNYLAGLRRQGYRVVGYGGRKEALAGFATRFPDLVIIDVKLGAEVEGIGSTTLRIRCANVTKDEPDSALVGRLRGLSETA